MNITYSIIMREVNKSTGKVAVKICEKGTKEIVSKRYEYLSLRSLLNEELTFYIALQENEKEAVKELKKKIVKESDLYERV